MVENFFLIWKIRIDEMITAIVVVSLYKLKAISDKVDFEALLMPEMSVGGPINSSIDFLVNSVPIFVYAVILSLLP